MLRSVRRVESEGATIRVICAGWLIAACGRLLSAKQVGRPDRVFRVLTGAELAIPAVVAPWQAMVARQAGRGR